MFSIREFIQERSLLDVMIVEKLLDIVRLSTNIRDYTLASDYSCNIIHVGDAFIVVCPFAKS